MNTDHNANKITDLSEIVTWAVLLSKWTRFAQSSVALPEDETGERWRKSVAPMIGLQAVCFALRDVTRLPDDERLLGIDRASVIIRNHARELDEAWRGEPMPEGLLEVMADARAALESAEHIAYHARAEGDEFVMPDVHELCAQAVSDGFEGELFASPPGTILSSGEPALVSRPRPIPFDVPGLVTDDSPRLQQQVYRMVDDEAGAVRDEVVPYHRTMPAGRPMLEHVVSGGRVLRNARSDEQVRLWIEEQARTMEGLSREVVWSDEDDESITSSG